MACGFLAATVGSTLVLFVPKAILVLGGADVNESFEIVRAPSSGGRGSSGKKVSELAESDSRGMIGSLISGLRTPKVLFSSRVLGDSRSVVDYQVPVDVGAFSPAGRCSTLSGKSRIRIINGEIENVVRSEMMYIQELSADKSSELK